MANNNYTSYDEYIIKKSKQCLLVVFAPLISVINSIFKYTLFFERNT